jgi:hypothetical protein
MKSFKKFLKINEACWTGYKQVGIKEKNGRKVPNCVPEEVDVDEAYVHTDFTDKTTPMGNRKAYAAAKANDEKKPVSLKKAPWDTKKEEVELDEVSDKKLDAYRQKAFANQPSGDDGSDKYRKRKFGRDLAFAKQTGRAKVLATKEEVELDEARSWFDTSDHEQFKNMTPEQKKARHDSLMKLATTHKNYDIRSFAKSAANELKSKYMKEEAEINEVSYRDSGYHNMLKASRKADKEADKMRAQQAAKASKPKEVNEEADLRVTKVYNKFPKKATYAVHSPDRKYYKEFDSMEKAKAHHAEKTGK